MRLLIPIASIALIGLLAFAALHDAAFALVPYLEPWFGWMTP
jgi:hypothetical protein